MDRGLRPSLAHEGCSRRCRAWHPPMPSTGPTLFAKLTGAARRFMLTGIEQRRTSAIWTSVSVDRSSMNIASQLNGGCPAGKKTAISHFWVAWCFALTPKGCARSCGSTGTLSPSGWVLRKVGESDNAGALQCGPFTFVSSEFDHIGIDLGTGQLPPL